MTHKIVKCRVCGKVVSNCRCPSANKPVHWVECDACKTPVPDLPPPRGPITLK